MVIPFIIVYDGTVDVSLAMLDSSYYGVKRWNVAGEFFIPALLYSDIIHQE